jgi:ankyrin repeat domain-containing protein 50
VHGLQGHPRNTWTCDKVSELGSQDLTQTIGGSRRGIKNLFSRKGRLQLKHPHQLESDEIFWPLDLLPDDCGNLRILTWGYDSKVSHFFNGAVNQSSITAHARNLLQALKVCRLSCVSRLNVIYSLVLMYPTAGEKPYIHSTLAWW